MNITWPDDDSVACATAEWPEDGSKTPWLCIVAGFFLRGDGH